MTAPRARLLCISRRENTYNSEQGGDIPFHNIPLASTTANLRQSSKENAALASPSAAPVARVRARVESVAARITFWGFILLSFSKTASQLQLKNLGLQGLPR